MVSNNPVWDLQKLLNSEIRIYLSVYIYIYIGGVVGGLEDWPGRFGYGNLC